MSISTPVKIISTIIFLVSGCFAICPEGIVPGAEVICPGQSQLFHCTTINVMSMGWNINGEKLFFSHTDIPGSIFPSNNEAIAYLVDRRVPTNSVIGNLTSILYFTPSSDNTTTANISCTSGSDACDTIEVLVYGHDGIDMPSEVAHYVTDGVITYQWDHPTRDLVSHYILTVNASGLNQNNIMNSTQLHLHVSSTNMTQTYSGTVRAVSICGHESDPLSFTGSIPALHVEPTMDSTTMKPDISILTNNVTAMPITILAATIPAAMAAGILIGIAVTLAFVFLVWIKIRGKKKGILNVNNSIV